MRTRIATSLRRNGVVFRTVAALTVLAVVISGCKSRPDGYRVADAPVINGGEKVLVLPFMDTRTFVDKKDPHKDDLGVHARDIFVSAMRENPIGRDSVILAPELPPQTLSLTNAQVAEYGRRHGADIVVAGQMFSYTDTRAASIPPRAGMFVRVVSARDGTLLFVGDHYQAAAVPGAPGGRELQARNVSNALIEGIAVSRNLALRPGAGRVSSADALASLAVHAAADAVDNLDPLPLPPAPLDLPDLSIINADDWSLQPTPELPPVIDFDGDFFTSAAIETVSEAEPETVAAAVPEPAPGVVPMAPPILDDAEPEGPEMAEAPAEETADVADEVAALEGEGGDEYDAAADAVAYDWVLDASDAARMSGDDMAADLFASESPLLEESINSPARFGPNARVETVLADAAAALDPEPVSEVLVAVVDDSDVLRSSLDIAAAIPAEPVMGEWKAWESALDVAPLVEEGRLEVSLVEAPVEEAEGIELAVAAPAGLAEALDDDNGPVVSVPLAVEQPRSFRSADLVKAVAADDAIVSFTGDGDFAADAVRVLVLPYHERENSNNLIVATGGGEVVTTLYGSQLALDPGIQVMWDGSGQTSHDRLIDREEALQLGRMVNADYVVRGQVVEFRRAQSVPSFYSAVISTAVLAAQVFFAEMSGVDVATEVYRVSDGACVMSRRDRSQQKYVVQAEKTVRKLADGMAEGVIGAVRASDAEIMDPLIDTLSPVTVLNNPWL